MVLKLEKGFLGFVAAFAIAITSAFGQTTEGTYRLQPEDVLRIQVFNQQQILAEIPIGKDGNISAPFAGIVQAAGKTTSELEAILTAEYIKKLRLREPIVSVTVLRYRVMKASVTGLVNRPQAVEIRPGDTVVGLISNAGGYVVGQADLKRATLKRKGSSELVPIDLYSMLVLGDTSQNYELQDGDELNIPEEQDNRILVLGSVAQPGTYTFKEGMTLADAVSLARGDIRYQSRMSKVQIVRKREGLIGEYVRMEANFVKYVKGGDMSQNVKLRPGDFIYVPESNNLDFNRISNLVNAAFIFDRFGGSFLGIRLFGG